MSGHEHTNRCYWDFIECRWVCRPARVEDDEVVAFAPVEVVGEPAVAVAAAQAVDVG